MRSELAPADEKKGRQCEKKIVGMIQECPSAPLFTLPFRPLTCGVSSRGLTPLSSLTFDFWHLGGHSPTHRELSRPHTIDPNYREVCVSVGRGQHGSTSPDCSSLPILSLSLSVCLTLCFLPGNREFLM